VLGRELGKRFGHTLSTINSGYELVWTWFGVLDTVGHMARAIDAPIERDWYHAVAQMTRQIRESTDATVISVSDHGLQNGRHTHYATLASDTKAVIDNVESVFDLTPWITQQSHQTTQANHDSIDTDEMKQVKDDLKQLGYIE